MAQGAELAGKSLQDEVQAELSTPVALIYVIYELRRFPQPNYGSTMYVNTLSSVL